MFISPRSTLSTCGNSSSRNFRKTRPTGVMRPSSDAAQTCFPEVSVSTYIVRNLYMVNCAPPRSIRRRELPPLRERARRSSPTRCCANSTGPRDVSLMSAAITSITGSASTRPNAAMTTFRRRRPRCSRSVGWETWARACACVCARARVLTWLDRRTLAVVSTASHLRKRRASARTPWPERAGHAVDPDHRPHLVAAVDWLARAQDAAAQGAGDEKGKGGVARGYSLAWSPMCGSCAWQPPVPGGAGEIIPVLYSASRHLRRSALADRAEYAALWELDLQLPSGAMRASWTERPAPSV